MRKILAILTVAILSMALMAPVSADRAIRQTEAVFDFVGLNTEGSATLTRTNSGVSMRVSTSVGGQLIALGVEEPLDAEWEVGDAVTNWFVVFNNPEACIDGCGEDDVLGSLFGPSNFAGVGVHFATGHVAGSSNWRSAASLREGDVSGLFAGEALADAMKAEIHIVIRTHGPASNLTPGSLAAAIGSIDGGCVINTCGDAQAAVFNPPTP